MAKKGGGERSGTVILTEMERMALERLDGLRREIEVAVERHKAETRRFLAAFSKARSTPAEITIETDAEGKLATWKEKAKDAKKETDGA